MKKRPAPTKKQAAPQQKPLQPPARDALLHSGRLCWAAIGAVCLTLALFSGKAFNIDDTLFIWAARHITGHPLDFYGFSVNWYGFMQPMADVTKNPPLACYYAAAVISLFGESERALHLAFILPAALVMLGTARLAGLFGARPLIAMLAAACTPVFFISATTVMCDMLMLCFWVWAVYFWMRGIDGENHLHLAAAAVLVCCSALTKYFGVSLIPLLAAYTLMHRRKPGAWIAHLLGCAAVLWLYNSVTAGMYGHGLLTDAVSYSQNVRPMGQGSTLLKFLVTLAFTGGCLLTALFYLPLLASRSMLALAAAGMCLLACGLAVPGFWKFVFPHQQYLSVLTLLQMSAFTVTGLAILVMAACDAYARRDAASALLLLWLLGTMVFAGFCNWTVNGRSVLPMAPAFGLMLARMVGRRTIAPGAGSLLAPLAPAAAVCLLVTWGDWALADSARSAAHQIAGTYNRQERPVFFQGHWGFQYYMEKNGCVAFDVNRAGQLQNGDIMAIPRNNTNIYTVPPDISRHIETLELRPCSFLSILHPSASAGFYASVFGPLPYAFGPAPPERYDILRITLAHSGSAR